jgi:hypothetical protein
VHWFPHARILVSHTEAATLYVAAGKGGAVVRVARDGAVEQDTGWRGTIAGRLTTTCWQERAAEVEASEQPDGWRVRTSMPLRRHGFLVPTPFKHLALRLVSAVAGRTLIPWLKRRLIFRQDDTGRGSRARCASRGMKRGCAMRSTALRSRDARAKGPIPFGTSVRPVASRSRNGIRPRARPTCTARSDRSALEPTLVH